MSKYLNINYLDKNNIDLDAVLENRVYTSATKLVDALIDLWKSKMTTDSLEAFVMLGLEKNHIKDFGDNLIKTRNVEKKIIYKYNFDTKQLLQKFNSTTEAAHHFDISNHTILRYISIQKIFSYKNEKNIILSYLDNIDNLVIKEPTKVIKSRPCKKLFTYYNNTNELFMEYNGPFDAAAKLKIGQCTVHRHIKNKKPLNIIHNVKKIQIIFTYSKNEI